MHIHNVYFWLKKTVSGSEKDNFESGLDKLLGIDVIARGYWGIPAGVDRPVVDGSFDYALTLFFETRKKHDIYQDHPGHREFIERHSSLWEYVTVLDTETCSK
jgi:hypothetical protein